MGAPEREETTGDARVDGALARLAELDGLPVSGHPAVFEHVHEVLTETLAEGHGRDGRGGAERPGTPAAS
jgi:hypothetical protein